MAQEHNNEHELSEIEQMQLDAILLDTAFNNAWLILSGELTFDQLMVSEFKGGRELIMAFDPDNGPQLHELQNMLEHFIKSEEYEKCAKIRDIIEKTYPETIEA